jgi:phospholipid/cholesterol/gamma-HCH transport system permease protein
MIGEPLLDCDVQADRLHVSATGPWTAAYAPTLEALIGHSREISFAGTVALDLSNVKELDTLGAWLLDNLLRSWRRAGRQAEFVQLPPRYSAIFEKIGQLDHAPREVAPPPAYPLVFLASLGRNAVRFKEDLLVFLQMLGDVSVSLARMMLQPLRFRLTSTVHHLDRVGWQAVPIILLITFLIGGIIAQQGFFHFRKFGADTYVVDMIGILVLREIGVLIVAIMVAGRSGSAYTAELGSMKMREEIDALRTMGFNPTEILILPRIVALICALPILTFLGSMAALYGGGLVAWLYGGMSPAAFIARLRDAISVTHFEVGMIKAPFMALAIGVVAAAEGLQVAGSAESLGTKTTTSVVKAIFLVIVLDGLFAIFFASIGM